jgi:hypothetical protein
MACIQARLDRTSRKLRFIIRKNRWENPHFIRSMVYDRIRTVSPTYTSTFWVHQYEDVKFLYLELGRHAWLEESPSQEVAAIATFWGGHRVSGTWLFIRKLKALRKESLGSRLSPVLDVDNT